ncbi:hypothetical protein Ahy_B03g064572 isoform A [Arachis hypogaea]|uniref:Uncharacterized protein n=1 Tax=Arachis hypogaea TaxID=3818 RepID=A0A444ZZW3_ARAHY|nr:hypothetical protein Ahy_B03g064572 isoform A [Arachis hypogaea]
MENTLKPGDIIQCRECGYCILYKKRTHRIVQYEARRRNQTKLDSVLACSSVSYFHVYINLSVVFKMVSCSFV